MTSLEVIFIYSPSVGSIRLKYLFLLNWCVEIITCLVHFCLETVAAVDEPQCEDSFKSFGTEHNKCGCCPSPCCCKCYMTDPEPPCELGDIIIWNSTLHQLQQLYSNLSMTLCGCVALAQVIRKTFVVTLSNHAMTVG